MSRILDWVSRCATCGAVWYGGSITASCPANENHHSTISGSTGRIYRTVRILERVRGTVVFAARFWPYGGVMRCSMDSHHLGNDPGAPQNSWGIPSTYRRFRCASRGASGGNPRILAKRLRAVRSN